MMHTQAGAPMMSYKMKPLGCDPQRVKGMSEKLIVSHYENNYGGAVKRLNLITEQLVGLDFNTAPGFLINGLKREELIASNSMILHELQTVLRAMRKEVINIVAIHQHMSHEQPRYLFLHYRGKGNAAGLAQSLKRVLDAQAAVKS